MLHDSFLLENLRQELPSLSNLPASSVADETCSISQMVKSWPEVLASNALTSPEAKPDLFIHVLRTPLHVFMLAFGSCLQHVQLAGSLTEELVPHWDQSSEALAFLVCYLMGYVWKQGHHPLVLTILVRKSFLFFTNVIFHFMSVLQVVPNPL